MEYRRIRFYQFFIVLIMTIRTISGQVGVPAGINYQAVARDSYGKELANTSIDVRFSIIIQNPLGQVVYQELHSGIVTSKYGVFSLIIGHGVPTGGIYSDLSQVKWSEAYHYLKVEVKFGNNFVDMGTMQFMAVPYALFAYKSLEPGPSGPKGEPGPQGIQGLKGDQGDPATDDQTLSVVNLDGSDYLAISGGNQVKISNIEKDGDPANEIQDLLINSDKLKITNNANAVEWDLSPYRQSLTYDPLTRSIGITGTSSTVNLTELKNDDDASATNELQDLSYDPGTMKLSLSKSLPVIDLSELKDDADASATNEIQSLALTGDNLSISGSNSVSLTPYKDNTDSQTLTYSETSNSKTLEISGGNTVTLDNKVAFRAGISTSYNIPSKVLTDLNFNILTGEFYTDGTYYSSSAEYFTAPYVGIYTFNVTLKIPSGVSVILKTHSAQYDTIIGAETSEGTYHGSITVKLAKNEIVGIALYNNLSYPIPYDLSGSFSGFRVY